MNTYNEMLVNIRKTPEWRFEKLKFEITDEIQRLLDKNKMTQKEFAAIAKVSQPYISKIMQGETNFTIKTLFDFANALDASIDIHFREHSVEKSFWIEMYKSSQDKVVTKSTCDTPLEFDPNTMNFSKVSQQTLITGCDHANRARPA